MPSCATRLPLLLGCRSSGWRRRRSLRTRYRSQAILGHRTRCRGHHRASTSIRGRASTDTATGGIRRAVSPASGRRAVSPGAFSGQVPGTANADKAVTLVTRLRRGNAGTALFSCGGDAVIVAPAGQRRNQAIRGSAQHVRPHSAATLPAGQTINNSSRADAARPASLNPEHR